MDKLNVFFFGDSICFGQGVSIHETWVSSVARQLAAQYRPKGMDTLVQSYSINGNTTRMALERIAYDIQGKDIDILVIQFGINDANIWQTDKGNPRVSREGFAANLQEIITRVLSFGVKTIILNTNHLIARYAPLPNSDVIYRDNVGVYNDIVRQVAAKNAGKVVLLDMEAAMERHVAAGDIEKDGYLLPDGVHLNVRGNELYYEHFWPVLQQVVDSLY